MAKFQTEVGEIEVPLIFNDPKITEEMIELRDALENIFGETDKELVGLSAGPNGEWTGIFRDKNKK